MVPLRLSDDLHEFGNAGLLPGEELVSLLWATADRGDQLTDVSMATPTAPLH